MMNYKKIILPLLLVVIVAIMYILLSLLIFRGNFSPTHYYSYDNMQESKEREVFVSDDLKMRIEGDSLKQVKGLNKKFYTCKSIYQQFYGFLICFHREDKEYRRVIWEEPIKLVGNRNWVVTYEGEYVGEAFYVGHCDAKIGDTITLVVQNPKTDYKIGIIKIFVE